MKSATLAKQLNDTLANDPKVWVFSEIFLGDEFTQPFCFIIHTTSSNKVVVHMATADGGFHNGNYCDNLLEANNHYQRRCHKHGLSSHNRKGAGMRPANYNPQD